MIKALAGIGFAGIMVLGWWRSGGTVAQLATWAVGLAYIGGLYAAWQVTKWINAEPVYKNQPIPVMVGLLADEARCPLCHEDLEQWAPAALIPSYIPDEDAMMLVPHCIDCVKNLAGLNAQLG